MRAAPCAGGIYYAPVGGKCQVVPPPQGAANLPPLADGAVDQDVHGATCLTFGGACHRPFYSGSGVIHEVAPGRAR